jgi:GH15 family glucan-1,4-alpha-glucosidase
MASPLEDYALIGNTATAALVNRDGSIDWFCPPRFDAPACFCALLGGPEHGRWRIAPAGTPRRITRRYRDGSLVLDTCFETETGSVQITDCMTDCPDRCEIVRVVHGLSGRVTLDVELIIRFDYGAAVPWVRRTEAGLRATAGPDTLLLRTPVKLQGEDHRSVAQVEVGAGDTLPFTLTYARSHLPPPPATDAVAASARTANWWRDWSRRSTYRGEHAEAVERSLLTLKALTYSSTGGIAAAPTSSLPEQLGGSRNWDYRYTWLRDATFTLYALLVAGYEQEAAAWREWLLRATAGCPEDLHIVYGIAGERRLTEQTLSWLPGYADSAPVRIGNAAYSQRQIDVYGEVCDALYVTRRSGLAPSADAWDLQTVLLDFLESNWNEPDNGIWEVRGKPRDFVHSKVMAWVAFDRAVKSIKEFGLEGPCTRWQALREHIHAEVCARGYDADRGSFVQHYGSKVLDGSLLLLPLVGFLPADDPRIQGTIAAIETELMDDGLVRRYLPDPKVEGVDGTEGVFLPCSFWLVDNMILAGRITEAHQLFDRLLALRNDVGLLSEEYDPTARRLVGNFPQAFTHVALVNSARNLSRSGGPGEHRAKEEESPAGPV